MEKIILPKKYSQNDTRWKNETLGTKGTIGAYGCTITCLTMAEDYFKNASDTPSDVDKKMTDNGGYAQGNLVIWGVFASLYGLKYSGKFANPSLLTKENMDQIKAAIDKGYPVLLQIDTVPATSAKDEHWILATGYDGDDFIVQDPWDGATKRITSWGVKPQKLIYEWCWYEGKLPTQNQQQDNQTITISTKERDHLVNGAAVRKDLAIYLGISDPDNAALDSFTKVIAGIKGTQTQLANDLAKSEKAKAEIDQKLLNKEEELARVKLERQEETDFLKAQNDELTKQLKNGGEPLKQALGRVEALQGQVNDANAKYGKALLEKTKLESDLSACRKGVVGPGLIDSITSFINGLIKRQ